MAEDLPITPQEEIQSRPFDWTREMVRELGTAALDQVYFRLVAPVIKLWHQIHEF